ncbi:DciA family protein [Nevskia sp.]|uniref:DciA family protein n=1 Tax=Nevskia sp. TaxID=1929292 RepID=UPI0025E621CB|nr:DciA family protein [Nevskia sp.]HET7797160.1 DciA family protein [Nevskia sp.]
MHADDDHVGAHLSLPGSPVQALLRQANRLESIQRMIRDWAREPLANSLRVAHERDQTLVIYADSAAAFTQIRYRQPELQQFLSVRLENPALKLDIKMRPAAQMGGSS